MFPLFGKSSKSPTEVVKALRESLNTLEKGGDTKKEEKAQEEVRYIIFHFWKGDEILLHLFWNFVVSDTTKLKMISERRFCYNLSRTGGMI